MKKLCVVASLVGLVMICAHAAGPVTPLTRSHRVLVWAQAKDPSTAQEVEFDLQALLADRQIQSERYSKVFPPPNVVPPTDRIKKMKQLSYDILIVLQPEGNVYWSDDKRDPNPPTLIHFLATPAGGISPVSVAPESTLSQQGPGVAVAARGPIAGNQGPDAEQVIKVGAAVFGISSGDLVWKGRFPFRASADMPTDRYRKRIAENAVQALEKAGLLVPRQ